MTVPIEQSVLINQIVRPIFLPLFCVQWHKLPRHVTSRMTETCEDQSGVVNEGGQID